LAIGDYLRIFRRFWWIVVIAAVVGGGAGYASSFLSTTEYESTARLFVTTQSGTSVGDAYQNNLFSQERVVSYAGLATSEQVAARALDQLKAPISTDELRSKITAAPLPQTVLLDITARDADPAAAQRYANAIADQLVNVASELETSRRGGSPAAGAILVDDASYGVKAAGLSSLYRVVLGVAAGVIIGLLLALAFGLLDSRMRRREGVEEVTGTALLGTLVEDGRHPAEAMDMAAGGVAVERLRELRTNLQFAGTADGKRPRVIAVTSPMRGDGRSTTAVDLATAFAETGRSVVLVDGDLVNPSLTERLHLSEGDMVRAIRKGLTTVLTGQHDVAEALIDQPGGSSFSLLPAGPVPSIRRQLWAEDSAVQVLDVLQRNFDYVIVDTPPLTEYTDGALAAVLGDGAIMLARIGHTKAAALRRALDVLRTANAWLIGSVVTCEPGHGRELSKQRKNPKNQVAAGQPADARPRKAQPTRGKGTAADQPTTEISTGTGAQDRNMNGAHRMATTPAQPEKR
jgi:capsular exopolysaccharide synthesis family protein